MDTIAYYLDLLIDRERDEVSFRENRRLSEKEAGAFLICEDRTLSVADTDQLVRAPRIVWTWWDRIRAHCGDLVGESEDEILERYLDPTAIGDLTIGQAFTWMVGWYLTTCDEAGIDLFRPGAAQLLEGVQTARLEAFYARRERPSDAR